MAEENKALHRLALEEEMQSLFVFFALGLYDHRVLLSEEASKRQKPLLFLERKLKELINYKISCLKANYFNFAIRITLRFEAIFIFPWFFPTCVTF